MLLISLQKYWMLRDFILLKMCSKCAFRHVCSCNQPLATIHLIQFSNASFSARASAWHFCLLQDQERRWCIPARWHVSAQTHIQLFAWHPFKLCWRWCLLPWRGEEVVDLVADDLYVLRYKSIKGLVEGGRIDLIWYQWPQVTYHGPFGPRFFPIHGK